MRDDNIDRHVRQIPNIPRGDDLIGEPVNTDLPQFFVDTVGATHEEDPPAISEDQRGTTLHVKDVWGNFTNTSLLEISETPPILVIAGSPPDGDTVVFDSIQRPRDP